MAKEEPLTSDISEIWSARWNKKTSVRELFQHRLFVEGYPVFKSYIPRDAKTILEVGAGSGRYGLMLAKDFPNATVVETDIVPESLEAIKRATQELALSNVRIEVQNVLAMTIPDSTADVVFCDAVIQHIPEHAVAIGEMARILKPGGVLILSSVNKRNVPHQLYKHVYLPTLGKTYSYGYEKNFSHRELSRLTQSAGLSTIGHDGFYFAYGVYRWKIHASWWRYVGGALNRVSRVLDILTGRGFSRNFGFEVFVVAQKPR